MSHLKERQFKKSSYRYSTEETPCDPPKTSKYVFYY